ncbi:MAG TPA: SLC13 family permease [Balneolales bacterium]|nr:SLC13 family permease [Balneolales bacterium]
MIVPVLPYFGALVMILLHTLSVSQAVSSIDYSTLILLFGLMMLSAQFDLGGFYHILSQKAANIDLSPNRFLIYIILFSAILSAILTNDVIAFAFAPIVIRIAQKRKWNPVPFLLTLVAACNIGSAITIIGNPQNMFIEQTAHLSFDRFILWCAPPSILCLILLYFWSNGKIKKGIQLI